MSRFYLPPGGCTGDTFQLDEREAHHASHVLRLKRGDGVVVLDGVGNEFQCEIADVSRKNVTLVVKQRRAISPLPCEITLLQALPKGKIIESIIQKSVELGARRIVPLLTERVVVHLDTKERHGKREKWQQVAIEAIKQCGAAWLPEIETPVTIREFLANWSVERRGEHSKSQYAASETGASSPALSPFELSLVGSLQPNSRHPRECFQGFQSKEGHLPWAAAVWIGPEGDFTPGELNTIQASGAQPISLGRLTLRVETAAIYSLSILNYELNSSQNPDSGDAVKSCADKK